MRVSIGWAVGLALVGLAGPALGQDRAAGWLRKPSLQDIMGVFPPAAFSKGLSGRARIACVVTVEGALRGCKVLAESPQGAGFGGAAIAVTPQLRMTPAVKNGAPVESIVQIPMEFEAPGPTTGSLIGGSSPLAGIPTRAYSNIPWSLAPSVADVAAAFPKKARDQKVSGRATLDCVFGRTGGVSSCDTLNEEPRGLGFSQAARVLAGKFQGPTADSKGQALAGAHAQILMVFPAEYLTNASPQVGKPQWTGLPTAEEFNAVFPAEARKAGILKARVTLNCLVAPDGRLTDCQTQSEDPTGYGFGAAAASLSGKFHVSVWTAEGLPTVGGRVGVPIRYEFQQPPPAKP